MTRSKPVAPVLVEHEKAMGPDAIPRAPVAALGDGAAKAEKENKPAVSDIEIRSVLRIHYSTTSRETLQECGFHRTDLGPGF